LGKTVLPFRSVKEDRAMSSVAELIMHKKPLITGATAMYDADTILAAKFTVKSRYDEILKLYTVAGGHIFLPRGVCPMGVKDNRAKGPVVKFDLDFTSRGDEQTRVIDEAVALLKADKSFILQAYTGFGKTIITMPIIAAIGTTTLVVVSKEDLIENWRQAIHKHLKLPLNQIGFIRQDKFDVAGKTVVIGFLHSLAIENRYPSWINDYFGFTIFDECHRLGAETFSRVASLFNSKLRMGLSATPERKDGKEVVFYAHIGPVRVRTVEKPMKPKVLRYITNWQCPRVVRKDKNGQAKVVKLPHTAGRSGHVLQKLANDKERNEFICTLIKTAHTKERNLVVFSDLRDHLDQMQVMVRKLHGIPGADIGFYVGGMSKHDLDKSSARPIIFATYQMMGEGTNIPWLDAALLATPRSDVEQIVGRILREYPDKKQPVVFDLVDLDSPIFKAYSFARSKLYMKLGAEVKRMTAA
jgi:superfamily II DNA or RNA helicase